MLVLKRKPGEVIVIRHAGVVIEMTVGDVSREGIRLAFSAPREVEINRQELDTAKQLDAQGNKR